MTMHTDFDEADSVRTCRRKKVYPTIDVAKLAVISIRKTSPSAAVRPYACRRCGFWHVGGDPDDAGAEFAESPIEDEFEAERARRSRDVGRPRLAAYGDVLRRRPRRRRERAGRDD